MTIRVATDIGGTFTDLVYLDEEAGTYGLAKVSTTPADLEQGVAEAIRKAVLDPASVSQFVHGTTVVINAITERKGASVGLLTTRGMRDVLEIARGNRPDIYNLRYQKPKPFVPRNLRLEARERMDANGRTVEALDEGDVWRAAAAFQEAGVEAVAICFLHAYANPAHEKRAGDIMMRLLPAAYVSLSHEISREWREYERTNTTVLNSYVGPMAKGYLETLERSLEDAGITGTSYVMQSNGGTSTYSEAKRVPINMVESGPAAGVIGAAELGRGIGIGNLITLDIGGTTAKTSLIADREVRITTDYKLEWTQQWAGYPVKVPVVDVVEIGSGGGSIAWLDDDGAVRVGPASAGANPGPAAYGRSGVAYPTVTDAQLIAGRLDPDYFLGGEMRLDITRAREAYAGLARRCAISIDEMARGVLRIANANMISALKLVSVQRGYDPRDFALIGMGGGGPLHAAYLARELHMRRVIIPVSPGHFSAFGMLTTDLRRDYIRTLVSRTDRSDPEELEARYAELELHARSRYSEEGFDSGLVRMVRAADVRYHGQEHTVHVVVPEGALTGAIIAELENRFHAAHEKQYTFRLASPIEIVNLHVTAFGRVPRPRLPGVEHHSGVPRPKGRRAIWLEDHGLLEIPVFARDQLSVSHCLQGPAVIEEQASTTLVYPGMTLSLDAFGAMIIEIED